MMVSTQTPSTNPEEKNFDQFNIFHTPIWGYVLREHHYPAFDYVDYILNLKSARPSLSKSNFGGWHSDCNLFDHDIFKELSSDILSIAKQSLSSFLNTRYSEVSGGSPNLRFTEMWANVNTKTNFNAHHIHEGILSGVFYLKVPENSGRLILSNPAVRSDAHYIRCKDYAVDPERLALIFFPSWLMHYVEPSNNDEERISISFNIDSTDWPPPSVAGE